MLNYPTLTHRYPDWLGVDGYEKLLYDAIEGDQSHFVHSEEVIESWRIVDDLLCTGDSCPIRTVPYMYVAGQWGPMHKIRSYNRLGLSSMNFDLTMEDYTIILNALHYYKKVEREKTFLNMMNKGLINLETS